MPCQSELNMTTICHISLSLPTQIKLGNHNEDVSALPVASPQCRPVDQLSHTARGGYRRRDGTSLREHFIYGCKWEYGLVSSLRLDVHSLWMNNKLYHHFEQMFYCFRKQQSSRTIRIRVVTAVTIRPPVSTWTALCESKLFTIGTPCRL